MKPLHEKLLIAGIVAFVLATLVLFFVWYDAHHEPGPPRAAPPAAQPG
jgi:hypothetical protein